MITKNEKRKEWDYMKKREQTPQDRMNHYITNKTIRKLMIEKNLTHSQIANKMGMSRSSWSAKINGYNQFTILEYKKLSDIFEISVIDIGEDFFI